MAEFKIAMGNGAPDLDLKKLFSWSEISIIDDECGEQTETAAPLPEQLRKLRVAGRRREVERFNLSFVCLQLCFFIRRPRLWQNGRSDEAVLLLILSPPSSEGEPPSCLANRTALWRQPFEDGWLL
nr:uncharacterized protein LOC109150750 isoform X1 [Ipomoea trifida]